MNIKETRFISHSKLTLSKIDEIPQLGPMYIGAHFMNGNLERKKIPLQNQLNMHLVKERGNSSSSQMYPGDWQLKKFQATSKKHFRSCGDVHHGLDTVLTS